jgi:methanethiol oxidase
MGQGEEGREALVYVAVTHAECPDALFTVDLDETSPLFGTIVHRRDMPAAGDQLHQLPWQRPSDLESQTHERQVQVTGEWGRPELVRLGFNADALRAGAYGHRLHVWDTASGRHVQTLDLGVEHQLLVSVCPAQQPGRVYGFAAAMISAVDLSGSIWLWHRAADSPHRAWTARRVITIPAEPADAADLPAVCAALGVVPPLVSHVALSPDDRVLYVCCWGTGEVRQYDVCDPFHPVLTGLTRLGGISRQHPHPGRGRRPLRGGPRMAEVSGDGRRLYVTSALHSAWDRQCYPGGIEGWLARCHADPNGGLTVDPTLLVDFEEYRPHYARLAAGTRPQSATTGECRWNASETP